MTPSAPKAPVPGWLVPLVSACAGVTVANIYLAYPVLPLVAADYGVDESQMQFIVTGTQLGYAAGLFLLTPLGDVVRRNRLLAWLVGLTFVGLIVASRATGPVMFAVASACFAFTTCAPHVLIPFTAAIVPPERQGRALSAIGAGLTTGIVLSRVAGGAIAGWWGWRAVYEVGAGLTLVVGLVTALLLPREPRRDPLPYHRLLGSMVRLARTKPQVRRAILVQLPIFATFNLVWVPLVFLLTGPDYGYSVAKAGLMGLLSMATVLTAPPAGRLLERRGPRGIMVAGFPLLAAGSLAMLWSTKSIVVVIAGVVLLVVGQQFIQLGNQSRVLNSTTRERSRVNTLFMTSNFIGASAASATAGYVYAHAGWLGVMVCAVAFSLAAVAIWGVTEWRTVAEERAAN